MKKLLLVLILFAVCYSAGQAGEPSAATEPAVYEVTLPDPEETGSLLRQIADALRALAASVRIERRGLCPT